MPLIHTTAVKTETHREGRGWRDGSTSPGMPRVPGSHTGSQERKGRILSPRALIQRVGGPGDTLTSDFGSPEARE